jgi:hypothetical protein
MMDERDGLRINVRWTLVISGDGFPMKKTISVIAACVGAPLLTAGIALPSASADPTNAPTPTPTVSNEPAPRNPSQVDCPVSPGAGPPGESTEVFIPPYCGPNAVWLQPDGRLP